MLKVGRYTVNEFGLDNGIYELIDDNDRILIDLETEKIMEATINNRTYKAERYLKSYEWLINELLNVLSSLEAEAEETEKMRLARCSC